MDVGHGLDVHNMVSNKYPALRVTFPRGSGGVSEACCDIDLQDATQDGEIHATTVVLPCASEAGPKGGVFVFAPRAKTFGKRYSRMPIW